MIKTHAQLHITAYCSQTAKACGKKDSEIYNGIST